MSMDAHVTLKDTPSLPNTAASYRRGVMRRRPGDPIGRDSIGDTREQVNAKLLRLCEMLIAAGGRMIGGDQLTRDLHLATKRSVRRLAAYGRVHHQIRQIVGLEGGDGYFWGDANPDAVADAVAISRRKAACSLYNASLYGSRPAVMEVVQLVLDFGSPDKLAAKNDELGLYLATENLRVGDILDALVSKLAETPSGRDALAQVGRRHAEVLVPADTIRDLVGQLDTMRARLMGAVSPKELAQ